MSSSDGMARTSAAISWKVSPDTPEGFLYYCDDSHHMGGHPWGLVRGSSRTRIYLWPHLTDDGFYFTFNGNEVFMAYEMVKMYLALKDNGIPSVSAVAKRISSNICVRMI